MSDAVSNLSTGSSVMVVDDASRRAYQGGPFLVPRKVLVHSLVARPELNALFATALEWSAERQRYLVRMDRHETAPIWIKPANLTPEGEEATHLHAVPITSPEQMLQTIFFNAVMQGNVAQVKVLLADSPTLAAARASDLQCDGMQDTALLVAAKWACSPNMLTTLLDGGCDVNAKDVMGGTPLLACANGSDTECAKLLLSRGADRTARLDAFDGMPPMTAYDLACRIRANSPAMIELLKPDVWDAAGPGLVLGSAVLQGSA